MTDSYRPVFIEVVCKSADGRVSRTITMDDYVESVRIELKTSAAWTGTLTLINRDGDLDPLIYLIGRDGKVFIRFGLVEDRNIPGRIPQYVARVIKYSPEFNGDDETAVLQLLCYNAALPMLEKSSGSWPAGTKPGKIARDIASKYGWPTRRLVGGTDVETIEDGEPLPHPISYKYKTALEFMTTRLARRAVGTDRKPFKLFFDPNGTFHYHTEDFLTGPKKDRVVKSFVYLRSQDGEVLSFAPSDNAVFSTILGARGGKFAYANSDGGSVAQTTTPEVISDKRTQDEAAGGVGGGSGGQDFFVSARDDAEAKDIAAVVADRLKDLFVRASMSVIGQHDVQPMDYVNIQYVRRSGKEHYLSGVYRVSQVSHQVDDGGWVSEYSMYRPGYKMVSGEQTPTVGQEVPVSPQSVNQKNYKTAP